MRRVNDTDICGRTLLKWNIQPIGVSEYHLCTDLPLDLKNALPAVEDIRSRIDMKK